MTLNNLVKTTLLITVAVPVAFVAYAQGQEEASVASEERPNIVLDEENLVDPAKMRSLEYDEREKGLKELLRHCVRYAAQDLGVKGGFANNIDTRITMPPAHEDPGTFLFKSEESGSVDDFFQRLNYAAESSIPKVAGYFIVAIGQLRDKDVEAVGDDDNSAATLQLHRRMAKGLVEVVRPVIKSAMAEKGMKRMYALKSAGEGVANKAPTSFDAENYLIEKVLEAFFTSMSKEEKVLRAKTSSCSEGIICWYLKGKIPDGKN